MAWPDKKTAFPTISCLIVGAMSVDVGSGGQRGAVAPLDFSYMVQI